MRFKLSRNDLISIAAFICLAGVMELTRQTITETDRNSARHELGIISHQLSVRAGQAIKDRIKAVRLLAQRWKQAGGLSEHAFRLGSDSIQSTFGGFQALNWVDNERIIRWVVPLEPNSRAVNANLGELEAPRLALDEADRTKQPMATTPIELLQGGNGVVVYVPLEGGQGGYLNAVFRLGPMFASVFSDEVWTDTGITIKDNGLALFALNPEKVDENGVTREIEVFGRLWAVTIGSAHATGKTSRDIMLIVLLAGLIAVLLRAYLARHAELNTSQERLAHAMKSTSDWVWETDIDNKFTYFSYGDLGLDHQMNIGRSRKEITADLADFQDWTEHDKAIEAREPIRGFEYGFTMADGSIGYLHINGMPNFDENGDFKGYRGTASNITERKLAEIALAESEQLLRAVVNNAPIVISVIDRDGRYVLANHQSASRFGLKPEDVEGKRLIDVLPDAVGEMFMKTTDEVFATGQASNFLEHNIATIHGQRQAITAKLPLFNPRGEVRYVVIISTDITEVKDTERQLRSAMEHAELANRAKSDFLAHMSHELRTPLNAIMGFSEAITHHEMLKLDLPRAVEYANHIHDSGTHLLDLINDVLDIAKIEAGKLILDESWIDISRLVESCISMMRTESHRKGIKISATLAPDLPPLRGDERALKQVLLNLTSNAVKFTNSGGHIDISASQRSDTGDLVLMVRDDGIGIADSDMEKILLPFGQVSGSLTRADRGTGLGLPLAKSLIELHGAELHLKSALNRGTEVSLTFPAERLSFDAAHSAEN